MKTLYEQDYVLWIETELELLKQGRLEELDLENLIEELADMGRSERRAITSLLTRLLEHLLKLAYWESERECCERGWKAEVVSFRTQISKLLKDSPSLKPFLAESFLECYQDARSSMSQLIDSPVPEFSPFSVEQVLEKDWFPELVHSSSEKQ